MAIAFVQAKNGTLSTATIAYTTNNTAGNTLILCMRASGFNVAVSDSQGNSWQQAGLNYTGNSHYQIWFALNCKAGANTITVTPNTSGLCALEYSGITGLDYVLPVIATQTPGPAYSSGSITPIDASNLVLTMFGNETPNSLTVSSITGGFTNRANAASNAFVFELIQASATAATAGCHISSGVSWGGTAVVFTDSAKAAFPCFCQNAGSASASVAFQVNNTLGNTLFCMARVSGAGTPTCADTQGNTWLVADTGTTAGGAPETLFYALNCKAGANTVTVTGSGTIFTSVAEYSGVNAIGQTAHATNTGTAFSVGPVTPPTANSLVIAGSANETSTGTTNASLSAGARQLPSAGSLNAFLYEQRRVSAAATTISSTLSPSVNWGGAIAVFYKSAGGVPNSLMMMGVGT